MKSFANTHGISKYTNAKYINRKLGKPISETLRQTGFYKIIQKIEQIR